MQKQFNKKLNKIKVLIEDIELYAVSGSQIDTDLLSIEKTVKELKKIRGTFPK